MEYKKRARKAGVTIEVALTGFLSVTVLFLVLGLFSQNLEVMAAGEGLNSLFGNNHSKIMTDSSGKDYTNSQENVGITGDNALLKQYLTDPEDTINETTNKYSSNPQNISDADLRDLAKALTILNCNGQDVSSTVKTYKNKLLITTTSINTYTTIINSSGDEEELTYKRDQNNPLNTIKNILDSTFSLS